MKIQILTCHHKLSKALTSKYITPIHVGKELNLVDIGFIGDNTGDNISYKNKYYCELTAQYWAWKNIQGQDYIGIMHYRRHLNFSDDQNMVEDKYGVVNFDFLSNEYEDKCGLTDHNIEKHLSDNIDIILPKKWDITSIGNRNNYEQYKNGEFLHIKDYDNCLKVLLQLYPDYEEAVNIFNNQSSAYFTNMFIMKNEIFGSYSEWLFSILFKFEKVANFINYNSQEKRVIGHIAERLLNIYILKNNLKIKELQRTFIKSDSVEPMPLLPLWDKEVNNHPIVISFDDKYAISGGVLIKSICENSDVNKKYEITILDCSISNLNQSRIKDIVKLYANFKIRFIDINAFCEFNECYTRAHFSSATYARLFIPKLFEKFEKVLFIDADTIVESDISELFGYDLGNNLVAGVRDIVMEGFYFFESITSSGLGALSTPEYLDKALGIKDNLSYIQAGLIIFNIKQMNVENTYQKFLDTSKEMQFWFLDQDILNKVLYKRILYLPLEWNVYHGNGNTDEFFPNLKLSTYFDFLKARNKPKMIHFAGDQKPWNTYNVDFSDNFIKYAKKTPWYEIIIFNRSQSLSVNQSMLEKGKQSRFTKERKKIFNKLNKLLPHDTFQRKFVKKVYYLLLAIYHKFKF